MRIIVDLFKNEYSTHFGVANITNANNPELRTGLLLFMSFRHFYISQFEDQTTLAMVYTHSK